MNKPLTNLLAFRVLHVSSNLTNDSGKQVATRVRMRVFSPDGFMQVPKGQRDEEQDLILELVHDSHIEVPYKTGEVYTLMKLS